ncbi:hypothetical protein HX039_01480 [Myroides marinus]|uniref:hypothetical protein n=1 Tax=Myroides marinus TaxID=703342 RepID=UPI0025787B94|nr:hypothetical protein [Myroides marinus]MDM1402778.1 hypothetical protein [Myroides marinus]
MRKAIILLLPFLSLNLIAQDDLEIQKEAILKEGIELYKSEKTSWQGTDEFLAIYSNPNNVGGYFSYNEGELSKCIFYSNSDAPIVIGTITIQNNSDNFIPITNLEEREFSTKEKELYSIRESTINIIQNDSFFKHYNIGRLNIIPLVNGTEKKVYVLTGPNKAGVVIFGNDYLLTFDQDNKLINKKQLHQNIIPIDSGMLESKTIVKTMHSHSDDTGSLITATDICTLLLYGDYITWEKHIVLGKDHYSIWYPKTKELKIVPRKEGGDITQELKEY